jgi:hypothetical protein
MRDLRQLLTHVHDQEIEIGEGPEPRSAGVPCIRLKAESTSKPSCNLSVLPDVDRERQDCGHMLRNGSYSAWFRTSLREGTGIVELNDGKVTGGDPVFAYSGSYVQNGDKFSASLTTRRHTQGQPSVFDMDNVDLTVTGKSTPTTASCAGTAKQAPGLAFEAIFVRMAD